MALILTLAIVFIVLVGSEFYWRKHAAHGEFSRKFVHITVGSFVAFWPFFLTWRQIELLSLAFLIVVTLSKYLHVFRAIHTVQRPTWGELFFAAAVGVTALITHNKWIYMTALLQMSLADGLAAIVGTRYGNRHRYSVFGHPKSVIGTLTFFVVSALILMVFSYFSTYQLRLPQILGLAVAASIIENIGVLGMDNLLVPVLIAVSLKFVS